ncbi:MAG: glycosyltransferase family 1 protein [bacterium]
MIIGIDASKAAMEKRTGVENYVYQLILNLQKIDTSNTYFLYTNKHLPLELLQNTNFIEKYIPFPKFWNKIRLPIALLRDKPDKYLQPVYLIPSFAPQKSIGVFHDLAFKKFPEAYSSRDIALQKKALKNLYRRANKIICVSNSARDDLLSIYPNLTEKLNVIHLASNIKPSPTQFKDLLNIKEKYFISIGRLEKRKNIKNIIKSFYVAKQTELPHKLVLIGKPGYGYNEICETIKSVPEYAKDILIPGFVDNETLYDLILGAEATLYPSLYEGFGLTALDSMSIGTPVITSNTSSMPEVVGSAALTVDPNNLEQISDAIIKIATDSSLRQDLSIKSIEQARHFSWQKTAEQTKKLLETL